MAELLPLLVAVLALLAAIVAVPGFDLARWSLVFMGLAAGQIYMAIAAFGLFLFVENRFSLRRSLPFVGYLVLGLMVASIVITTFLSPTTARTYSELAQLALYILLFLLLTSFIQSGERLMLVLRGAFFGAMGGAILGLISTQLGWLSAPDIYVGRGPNEGATFMSLIGIVSGTVLTVRTRNPVYIIGCLLLFYTQILSTSRSAMGVSAVVMAVGGFFFLRSFLLRAAAIAAAAVVAVRNLPVIAELSEGQLNFSARERLALIEHGWHLSFERFWTGFGWGATDTIAAAAPTTQNVYPHFHNTYVQLLAELGVLGWIILGAFLAFMLISVRKAVLAANQPAVPALVIAVFVALLISANFDALLFGADRSVQVVILLAMVTSTLTLGATRTNPSASNVRIVEAQAQPLLGRPGRLQSQ